MTHPVDNKIYLHDSGRSRPSDREGGGEGCHPVPEISGGPVLQQIFPPLHDYLTIIPRAQMGH